MSPTPSEASDQELAREARAGSLEAFEQLVFRYESRIYGFVLRICRNPDDAREATQETFMKAHQSLRQYHPERSFAAWLFGIARNHSIDLRRRRAWFCSEPPPEEIDSEDPSKLLIRREERKNLWEIARRRLPELQFQALWLRYAEEMEIDDIAAVLRKTKTHVKVLLFRARQVLSRELKAQPVPRSGRVPPAASPLVAAEQKGIL